MNHTLSLRLRVLITGLVAGVGVSTLTLAATTWLGFQLGAAVGMTIAAAFCGAATLSSTALFERIVTEHLAAIGGNEALLPMKPPRPLGDGALNDMLTCERQVLERARRIETDTEEIERLARTYWTAVNVKPGTNGYTPDSRQCITELLDLFRQTADTVVRFSSSLEEANERMASGAVDQSETVSRTTTTVEALSEKIDRISQNAENATEACDRTRQEARCGLDQVHRVIEGMDRLHAQIEVNGRKARRLGDRSVEIGTIVELIRGISSRTDMLALNATIESVRAGEHGRGFAVVADEIRKLAERTAAATRDIGTLVEAIQADTHESIRALGEEQTEMEQESERVRETGSALERISQVAEHSAQLVDGISRSSNDQVVAAQELVRAMQRISDVSQVTLERAEQSRESIRGLAQWCERLSPLASVEKIAPCHASSEGPSESAPASLPWRKRRLAATVVERTS